MPVRARRGIEALAILLVILLGVSVLLPLNAAAAAQVTGFIGTSATCPTPATPVPGATVTLVDVNGIVPPATTTTDGGGVYVFTGPPPASYTITANHPAYYGAENGTPVRFDGSQTKRIDLCLLPHGTPTSNLAVTVLNGATPVPGATVAAFQSTNPTNRIQLVAQGITGSTGVVNLTLWDASFQLRTSAALLPTVESTVAVSGPTSVTVNLSPVPLALFGHVQNSSDFLGSGVVAWLYNPLAANTSLSRLIPGTVTASFFQFETARVPSPATYTLIVDANGYLSSKESITIPGVTNPHDVTLRPAPPERYDTIVAYGAADWNNLTAWRNLTLNADSTLPGLGPTNLRNLRLQIDSTLGNGDGNLSAGEITAFQTWICSKGPAYVATDGFFTTNGHAYNSTAGPCGLTVSPTLTNPNGGVWINTTTATPYKIKRAPPYIAPGAKTYDFTLTTVADSNISAYQNYTYTVVLPKKYELDTTTVVPANAPVTTQDFTRFTVDPGVTSGKPQIRMTVSQSLNGTARAKVTAPTGKFYVQNANFTKYQAYVANNTNLTFSAGDSTDPNDHVTEANFTWRFTTNPVDGPRLSRDSGQDPGFWIRVGFRRRDPGPDGPRPELYVPEARPVQGEPDRHGQRRMERGERDAERAGERHEGSRPGVRRPGPVQGLDRDPEPDRTEDDRPECVEDDGRPRQVGGAELHVDGPWTHRRIVDWGRGPPLLGRERELRVGGVE